MCELNCYTLGAYIKETRTRELCGVYIDNYKSISHHLDWVCALVCYISGLAPAAMAHRSAHMHLKFKI